MNNRKILDVLITLAKEKPPEVRNFRICAAVVYKHREIISVGYPRRKSHPIQKEFGNNEHSIFLHAEVEAILKAKRSVKLDDSFCIYVARVKQLDPQDRDSLVPGNAMPCKGCTDFIQSFGIKQVIFTETTG